MEGLLSAVTAPLAPESDRAHPGWVAVLGWVLSGGNPPMVRVGLTGCPLSLPHAAQPSTPCTTSARSPSPSTSWTVSHHPHPSLPPCVPPTAPPLPMPWGELWGAQGTPLPVHSHCPLGSSLVRELVPWDPPTAGHRGGSAHPFSPFPQPRPEQAPALRDPHERVQRGGRGPPQPPPGGLRGRSG